MDTDKTLQDIKENALNNSLNGLESNTGDMFGHLPRICGRDGCLVSIEERQSNVKYCSKYCANKQHYNDAKADKEKDSQDQKDHWLEVYEKWYEENHKEAFPHVECAVKSIKVKFGITGQFTERFIFELAKKILKTEFNNNVQVFFMKDYKEKVKS